MERSIGWLHEHVDLTFTPPRSREVIRTSAAKNAVHVRFVDDAEGMGDDKDDSELDEADSENRGNSKRKNRMGTILRHCKVVQVEGYYYIGNNIGGLGRIWGEAEWHQ